MKARIIEYDYAANRVVFGVDGDFATQYDKYKGKDVNLEIKKWSTKRSGAANRYMWVLVDKIAKALCITKNEVYRREIMEIGGCSDVVLVLNSAIERFCRSWEAQGLGWQTEIVPVDDERSNVICYYGSSTFDREQMTQLIENLIFEAENLGIDTETPDKALWWESLMEGENARG